MNHPHTPLLRRAARRAGYVPNTSPMSTGAIILTTSVDIEKLADRKSACD